MHSVQQWYPHVWQVVRNSPFAAIEVVLWAVLVKVRVRCEGVWTESVVFPAEVDEQVECVRDLIG
jgi:hypothetical protein